MKTIEEVILELNGKEGLSFEHVPWHPEEYRSFCSNREQKCLNDRGGVNRCTEIFRAKTERHYWMKFEVCLECGWSESSNTGFMPWYFGKRDGY
ncbi:MAG: hypothetical protein A2374_03390 [Candidatus Moranbacteria bacterium RIFOXYB1_FULL_44_23]|nr:MAG: hypothetical protein A2194_02380 [Candidatus Moranbacteria bacterium RIFOXYA1_FULL_44_8]OGI34977.1 MAG: hypothetical protein A2407_00430 [Candidatus Moranbacteria bacterium RIFOXYC1_FULL_44_8]OGI39539.1 MAG: hypothetical protein A2374_03390 [Candidatus Moranbacteria bacterium RIFOXYB1_FULL_44_23]OGI43220.1 MAG: hypothetical protein A2593_02920 [Candidatus Moranbacteria bacterium RIFOXYD1_FULL_44_9]HBB36628.1 hypothetical protein [Candidatus Moranbacteria bacterium]